MENKQGYSNIEFIKKEFINIDSYIKQFPVEYPSEHCLNGERQVSNIKILKNGNVLFINELVYSTDDSYGSDFDVYFIEIYDYNLTKLINKMDINCCNDIFLLKNDSFLYRQNSKYVLYDIIENKFIKKKEIDKIFHNLYFSKHSNNYFNGIYNYKLKNYSIEVLNEKLEDIKTINLKTSDEYYNFCNNIYEIPSMDLISALFLVGKIIFVDNKENKVTKTINLNNNAKKHFYFMHSNYDNVIVKNKQLYVGVIDEILIINLITLEKQLFIKISNESFGFYCFYDLNKDNVLVAVNNIIYIINPKNIFISKVNKINETEDGFIRFEKINNESFRLITRKGGIIRYEIKYK